MVVNFLITIFRWYVFLWCIYELIFYIYYSTFTIRKTFIYCTYLEIFLSNFCPIKFLEDSARISIMNWEELQVSEFMHRSPSFKIIFTFLVDSHNYCALHSVLFKTMKKPKLMLYCCCFTFFGHDCTVSNSDFYDIWTLSSMLQP